MAIENKSEVEFLKMVLNIQKEGCFGKHLDELILERIKVVGDKVIVHEPTIKTQPVIIASVIPTITEVEHKVETLVIKKVEPVVVKGAIKKEVVKNKATKK
jgi:hypothetical protein